jgi:hypothetical protein
MCRDNGGEVRGPRRLILIEEAFEITKRSSLVLSVNWRGIPLCCHLFDLSEIEVDLAPRDVASEVEFASLLEVMLALARETELVVVLTPENEADKPLLRVTPAGDVSLVAR